MWLCSSLAAVHISVAQRFINQLDKDLLCANRMAVVFSLTERVTGIDIVQSRPLASLCRCWLIMASKSQICVLRPWPHPDSCCRYFTQQTCHTFVGSQKNDVRLGLSSTQSLDLQKTNISTYPKTASCQVYWSQSLSASAMQSDTEAFVFTSIMSEG